MKSKREEWKNEYQRIVKQSANGQFLVRVTDTVEGDSSRDLMNLQKSPFSIGKPLTSIK